MSARERLSETLDVGSIMQADISLALEVIKAAEGYRDAAEAYMNRHSMQTADRLAGESILLAAVLEDFEAQP